MFQYIEDKAEIARAQRKLEATIRRDFRIKTTKDIGWQGGRQRDAKLVTDGCYWFWSEDHRGRNVRNPRRLNWFGTLSERPGVAITVEVNTSYAGISGQAGGAFAREANSGRIYLLHSGRVGGGAKGVGKQKFLTWCTSNGQTPVEVLDSSGKSHLGLPIMAIDGTGATKSAIRYVNDVKTFKAVARRGLLSTSEFRQIEAQFKSFYGEGRGQRRGERKPIVEYISRHGDVVDALFAWRQSKPMSQGAKIVKNIFIDMGVSVGTELVELFEVKSDASRQTIYSALGQLMVHSVGNRCKRTLVLPSGTRLSSDIEHALRRLGILLLRYRLNAEKVEII